MNKQVKQIREIIKHIPGAWVRRYSDNDLWSGYDHMGRKSRLSKQNGTMLVKETLEAAGFKCEMNGIKGTSGEYIIEIVDKL